METVIKMLKELHPDVDFESADGLIDDGILDSLDIVSMVSDINDQYGVSIGAEDIIRENFETPEEIRALIMRRGGEVK